MSKKELVSNRQYTVEFKVEAMSALALGLASVANPTRRHTATDKPCRLPSCAATSPAMKKRLP